MADAKSFRTKELSKMSVDELKKFVKDVQGAGIKGSKEVDKAINLLKVQQPERYGAKTVESAKTSLQTQSSIPTLQKLGIAVPDWKQQQANAAAGVTPTTGTTGMTSGLSSGMTSGISSSNPYQTPEIQTAQKEIDTITAARNQATELINDNPFYSEATRVGKVAKLNEKFNADLALAQNKLTTAQTNAQNAYKMQQDALNNNREIFKTYVSTGALAGASEAELQQISKATGYPIGVIKGAVNQIKLDQQAKLAKEAEKTAFNWDKVPASAKKVALEQLQLQDTANVSNQDFALSPKEYAEVVDAVALEVGDVELAEQIVIESMRRNNYKRWGETQPLSINYQGLNNKGFA
jgi:hypothetical protein